MISTMGNPRVSPKMPDANLDYDDKERQPGGDRITATATLHGGEKA
jgi:hypothetical protein